MERTGWNNRWVNLASKMGLGLSGLALEQKGRTQMRIELYILGAQVFDLTITKDPKKIQIGFGQTKGNENGK